MRKRAGEIKSQSGHPARPQPIRDRGQNKVLEPCPSSPRRRGSRTAMMPGKALWLEQLHSASPVFMGSTPPARPCGSAFTGITVVVQSFILKAIPGLRSPGMTFVKWLQMNCDRPGIEPTMGPITSSPAFSRP
jgi:hypothetical protein